MLEGVREVVKISASYKLASRAFKPEGTVVKVGLQGRRSRSAAANVVMMAGPCTVESAEQYSIAPGSWGTAESGSFAAAHSSRELHRTVSRAWESKAQGSSRRGGQAQVARRVGNDESDADFDVPRVRRHPSSRRSKHAEFRFLKELAKVRRPVLLKRGPSGTIEEWLLSAEYIMIGGNHEVMLCERGIRTFENYTRNTLDISAIPVIKKLSHLPILADPSHPTGRRDKVPPMARAAVAAGADGLLIEVHHSPENALCDGPQSLYPDQFRELMSQLKMIAPAVQRGMA